MFVTPTFSCRLLKGGLEVKRIGQTIKGHVENLKVAEGTLKHQHNVSGEGKHNELPTRMNA